MYRDQNLDSLTRRTQTISDTIASDRPHKLFKNRTATFQSTEMDGNKRLPDGGELILILLVLTLLQIQADDLLGKYESLLATHLAEQRKLLRSLPIEKLRPTFDSFVLRIKRYGNNHFRRMFRMSDLVFRDLCSTISNVIGEDMFRSENFLKKREERYKTTSKLLSNGLSRFVSGEFKVAISIRILAGGSYLDLCPLFDVRPSYIYVIFDEFLGWVLKTFEFPLTKYLHDRNWPALYKLSEGFTNKTDGVFKFPFAAIDGIAVRITAPTERDGVYDPGNYWCRKGFYALNVQAMCDRNKSFLWCYSSNKGATHDSTAFANSSLYNLLEGLANVLADMGLFIVGDAAYWLSSFMMTPYNKAEMSNDTLHHKDAYNFYQSSCRIHIECAFGELIMRWGIFWRALWFDLSTSQKIIQVAMLLHNFILKHREVDDKNADRVYFENFDIPGDDIQNLLTEKSNEIPVPLTTDTGELAPRGRQSVTITELKRKGEEIRTLLTVDLAVAGLS